MKKAITYRLCIVIAVSMLLTVLLSYYLQIKSAKDTMYANSMIRIDQVAQILEKNDADMERLKENLQEDYFIRAKAAAYIIQNHPEVTGNQAEMAKIAALLQVDELHLFNTDGLLFSGSEPKYYGYTFNSGEQMQFFLPMLQDTSLQLCQDVLPNTAESKLMQYIAVWREDHQGIIQIGMEPVRLLEAMEKNELSHIFTMLTTEQGMTIFVVDPQAGLLLGTTNDVLDGKTAGEIGLTLDLTAIKAHGTATEIRIAGERNYCVLRPVGSVLVGVSTAYQTLYQEIPANMKLVIFSLCILSIAIIVLIMRMLDRYTLKGIYGLIDGMKKIAAGDLDARVSVSNTPEFVELSGNINHMVESLLETTSRLSLVFQNVDIPIAVYEYSQDMKRVLATSKIGEILMLSEEEIHVLLADHAIFKKRIQQLYARPFLPEKDIYQISETPARYVKMKSYEAGHSVWGIMVDMTEEVMEKEQIKFERDIDLLTGLTSRRAFFERMDQLLQHPEDVKTAMLLMADLDRLKYVNDNWGHEYGDKILQKAAELLKACEAPQKIVARLSGDEFVSVIYGANSQEEIQRNLDHLYTQIQKAFIQVPNGTRVPVRLSGGYLFYPEFHGSCPEMLHLADQALYEVKRSCKGCFRKYQAGNPPK